MARDRIEITLKEHDPWGEILRERRRQDKRWGQQDHPPARWLVILMEEVGEAARATLERKPDRYRAELVQVAAVAVAAIESLDRQRRYAVQEYPVLVVAGSAREAEQWMHTDMRRRRENNDRPVSRSDYRICAREEHYVGRRGQRIVYAGHWWHNPVTNQEAFLAFARLSRQSPPGYP